MRSHEKGMSLVELMTVVVIVGVLASIAVPGYRQYLLRANRSDAKNALMQVQSAQEKFYLQNNRYAGTVAALGTPGTTTNGYYSITIAPGALGDQSYTATAEAVAGAGQTDDTKCGKFSITETGKKDATGTLGSGPCWK
jgi:type IV pilus assembly protein PilE